jgi:hypothetical protein
LQLLSLAQLNVQFSGKYLASFFLPEACSLKLAAISAEEVQKLIKEVGNDRARLEERLRGRGSR